MHRRVKTQKEIIYTVKFPQNIKLKECRIVESLKEIT